MTTAPPPRLKDIPVLDSKGSNLKAFADAVREALQTYRGYRGNDLDRGLTVRDALEGGYLFGRPGIGVGLPGPPGVGIPGPPGSSTYVPDLTPPPTPTGFVLTAGFSTLFIECDVPSYTQGHGHQVSILYGAKWPTSDPSAPTFSEAVELMEFQGTIAAYPTELATRWCCWLKWKSVDGVLSVSPAGGTNGQQATTALDVSALLQVLTGQITESQLYKDLGTRINLIEAMQGQLSSTAQSTLQGMIAAYQASQDAAKGFAFAQTELTTKINEDVSAEAAQRLLLAAALATTNATLSSEQVTRATNDEAIADDLEVLTATVNSNNTTLSAAVANEATARANGDSAISSTVSTLSAQVGTNSTAIATEATARANADGSLFAQYTVKIDTNDYVSGFGLASTAVGAAPFSSFIVRADSFSVASPSGPGITPAVPFIVRTTPGTINGVSYPAGVYMDAAYILDLTTPVARLGTAWIDDAMIANLSAAKINAGSLTVGSYIQSTGFVSGSTGWKIQGNGSAEFGFANIRGTLLAGQISAGYVSATMLAAGSVTAGKISVADLSAINADMGAITSGSITLDATGFIRGGQSTYATGTGFWMGNVGGVWKFSLGSSAKGITWDGSTFTIKGTLSGVDGTFSGDLSAAGGTFDGTLTANSLVLAGRSIVNPVYASSGSSANAPFGTDGVILTAPSINPGATGSVVVVVTALFYGLDVPDGTGDGGGGSSSTVVPIYHIKRNGTTIATWAPYSGRGLTGYTIADTPGGAAVYTLTQTQNNSPFGVLGTSTRTMTVLGITR